MHGRTCFQQLFLASLCTAMSSVWSSGFCNLVALQSPSCGDNSSRSAGTVGLNTACYAVPVLWLTFYFMLAAVIVPVVMQCSFEEADQTQRSKLQSTVLSSDDTANGLTRAMPHSLSISG